MNIKTTGSVRLGFLGLVLVWLVFVLGGCSGQSSDDESVEIADLEKIAESAYIFGFSMVENYNFMSAYFGNDAIFTTNTLNHARVLATPEIQQIVKINNDTIASGAVLDLRSEPVVISVPEVEGRYYSIQLLNIVTDNLPIIASGQEGSREKNVVIAGPDWDMPDFLDDDVTLIRSDSEFVVAILRISVRSQEDISIATTFQDQTSISTFSEFYDLTEPEIVGPVAWLGEYNPKIDAPENIFSYINFMAQYHQFSEQEQTLFDGFSAVGVEAGQDFSIQQFSPGEQQQIRQGVEAARLKIRFPTGFAPEGGWTVPNEGIGNYGNDYLLRAIVAWYGLYALPLSETVYLSASTDLDGSGLDGGVANYVMHFNADELPEANYFWSITLYDPQGFLMENNIDRYSIGDRSDLDYNDDGSLTLYIQHDNPGVDREKNWLPAPASGFNLTFRFYGPVEAVQSAAYRPPAVAVNN